MNITATISLYFSAAKRLRGQGVGVCGFVHGYTHHAEIAFCRGGGGLNDDDMVEDFHMVKGRIRDWIDEHWDHNLLLAREDEALGEYVSRYTGQAVFYFDANPTSEVMAQFLMYTLGDIFAQDSIVISSVRIYDTPHEWVEARGCKSS